MSALICVILLAISAATKNTTILLAAGLFAIAAEIAYKDWYFVKISIREKNMHFYEEKRYKTPFLDFIIFFFFVCHESNYIGYFVYSLQTLYNSLFDNFRSGMVRHLKKKEGIHYG